jgi:hypothetical protein
MNQWQLILESLRNDMMLVSSTLHEIAEHIIEESVSEYPVFVAAQQPVQLGRPVPEIEHLPLTWFFSASTLEEFVLKNVVNRDKLMQFQRTFSDPSKKACIFVITEEGARFVFVPYLQEEA